MEGRLSAKLEKASEASREAAQQARLNSESLEQLESRVDANEEFLMNALRESEARITAQVQSKVEEAVCSKVKDMVSAQLAAAGFDQELSAGDLSMRQSARGSVSHTICEPSTSYAGAAVAQPVSDRPVFTASRSEKQEVKFWTARRSLRLWPLPGGSKESLEVFLRQKLRLDKEFVDEELGQVAISRTKEPRNKNKDEFIVTFESKQIRDAVKAAAPNLANHRDSAGMRLQVPDHLQRDFKALMNLSYDLKKRHPNLKRNVKFDEDDYGLFMDIKLNESGDWKRVKPAQAHRATKNRKTNTTLLLEESELQSMLGPSEDES